MHQPFLLLMPSYNQAHFIVDAVRSILAQEDPNWELWIVDNSSDQTPQVMRQFADPRIRYQHIPARMDPGSCLNWMLERASGRDFSYVHTDNNLGASYVGRMREALSLHPLGLAYCDMRTIDEHGAYTHISQRGSFDLPRLLSIDTLGVPFAATVELAKKVGGFSAGDFADDVRFCVSAFGLAEYIYVPEPLMDYRLHSSSRTEEAGGGGSMHRIFVDLMPKIVPQLEKRGLQPLAALEKAIGAGLDNVELYVEDFWYRKFSKRVHAWWSGYPRLGDFFFVGLLDVPGFTAKTGRPPLQWQIKASEGGRVMPWNILSIRGAFRRRRRELRRLFSKPAHMLPVWAAAKLGVQSKDAVSFRIASADFRTIWAARQLQLTLGWTPLIDPSLENVPTWIRWQRALGTEPLLDCSSGILLK